MRRLTWSTSHAVFVTEIDDEHKEIFEALADLQTLFEAGGGSQQLRAALDRLTGNLTEHFAHEERLMHAARYRSLRWHRQRHNAARRRVTAFVRRIERDDRAAGAELVEYLTSWLDDHTRVADRMMGAALRNHQRCMWTLTFTAGTKPLDACDWVTANGERLEPPRSGARQS